MIANIIDKRTNHFSWKTVNAIIEATWHDNSGKNADQAERGPPGTEIAYDQRECISIEEAIMWAQTESGLCPVTLFIYDDGAGTNIAAVYEEGTLRLIDERPKP